VSFTIQNVLIPAEYAGYSTVDVQIIAGKIAAIAPTLPPQGTLIDGHNKLLLPGFVNAHTHSSEMWQRGLIPPYPLELWLANLYDFPLLTPEQVYLSALGTAVETLQSGGTTLVDHLVLIPGQELETIAAAVRAYREIGIRAFVAPLVQDEPLAFGIPAGGRTRAPVDPGVTAAVMDLVETAIAKFHAPQDGIAIIPAPTGIQLCSDRLFEGCVELSDRYDLCLHAHLLETKAQKMLAQEKYGGSAVEHLQTLGFLRSRTSLAHCVWLTAADIEILATTQSTVVHNPLSNLRLGSGIAPVLKYLQAGVNVTFGCDGAASNDGQDLLEAIKIGSLLHNTTDSEYKNWIPPRKSVEMAALGGAIGLGMGDAIGSLTVGKQADVVLYDLMSLSLLPRTDPLGQLLWGRPTQAVHSAWVAGKRLIADGQVITVDVDQLRQQLLDHSAWSDSAWGGDLPVASVSQATPNYRQAMGLPAL
jgi:5-methylthioadenosine/S-adenosylhomocysteine deaminase